MADLFDEVLLSFYRPESNACQPSVNVNIYSNYEGWSAHPESRLPTHPTTPYQNPHQKVNLMNADMQKPRQPQNYHLCFCTAHIEIFKTDLRMERLIINSKGKMPHHLHANCPDELFKSRS